MNLGNSDPNIYGKMQYGGKISEWNTDDWYSILAPLESAGFRWSAERMRMERLGPKFVSADTPWVHVKSTPSKRCAIDHHLLYGFYRIIPKRCLNCWKVVVTPDSFEDLMKLEEVERKMDLPSKCGIELRDYTPKHYGGYYYNNSLDEGRECYDKVCDAVRDGISEKCASEVILKRGCTEFEMITGPSPFWHITPEEEDFCRDFEAYVDMSHSNYPQHPVVQNHVRLKWVLWAHANGDMTYKEFNGDKSLFPGYVKYHDGDINMVKRDLAVAQAKGRDGIDPSVSSDWLNQAVNFADANDITVDALSGVMGAEEGNPLKWGRILTEVPDELKGEHDELT